MKGSKKLIIILTLIFIAAALSACSGGGEGIPYTVTFVTNEGSAIQTAVVNRIEKSPESTRNNYKLEGWYLDSEFSNPVSFPYTVTKETVIYAKWQRVYNVNYIIDGIQRYRFSYAPGAALERLSIGADEFEGYTFNGWTTNIPEVMPEMDLNITGTLTPKTYYICFDNTQSGINITGTTTAYTTTKNNKEITYPAIAVTYGKTFYNELSAVKATRNDDYDFDKWTNYVLNTGYVDFDPVRTDLWKESKNILLVPQWAETGTVGLRFELNEEGSEYFVSDYVRDGTYVRVPNRYRASDNLDYKPVTAIGDNAFNGKSTLTEIVLPTTITSIGRMAFAGASELRKIELPASLTDIGDRAFEACVSLTDIRVPGNVKAVSNSMFADCINLETVNISDLGKLTKIGEYAFFGAGKLKLINIPKSVTSIGNFAFQNTTNLKSVTFGAESPIKTLGTGIFKGSGIEEIVLPAGIQTIAAEAFADCISLKRISLPSAVNSVGYRAFAGALSLERVFIPSGVTQLAGEIFLNCDMLSTINLGAQSKPSGWSVDWDIKRASAPPERFGNDNKQWGAPA